jgi:acetylornithine deacetylase/succinyl-diaminopimelate desuccinylase-like protein
MKADWVITESGGSVIYGDEVPAITALTAEKGAWRIRITIRRDPVHSSMAFGSQLSTQVAAEAISRINQYSHPIVITTQWRQNVAQWAGLVSDHPLLDPSKIDAIIPHLPALGAKQVHAMTRMTSVVTGIETEDSWNTVPAEIRLELDVRTLLGQSLGDVYDHINAALADLADSVDISVVAGSDGSASPTETPLWDLMTDAARVQIPGARLRPVMASGITDARFFRQRGASAYGFGLYSDRLPHEEIPKMLHGDNERVDVGSLQMMDGLWPALMTMFGERTQR